MLLLLLSLFTLSSKTGRFLIYVAQKGFDDRLDPSGQLSGTGPNLVTERENDEVTGAGRAVRHLSMTWSLMARRCSGFFRRKSTNLSIV